MNMLHIVNGDAALALIKQTSIEGEFLVFKEMLMEGPVHLNREGLLDTKSRAEFLKSDYGIDSKIYLKENKTFFSKLENAAAKGDQITFWFEEDFFCQIHLIYLLAYLPKPFLKKGKAFFICPEKALGVHLPKAMQKLFDARTPLEPARIVLAKKVWKAFSTPQMEGWSELLKWTKETNGFQIWDLLQRGLRAYLGMHFIIRDGYNPVQEAIKRVLKKEPQSFPQFYKHLVSEKEVKYLGLGDSQVARYALNMTTKKFPLVKITGSKSAPKSGEPLVPKGWKLSLTKWAMPVS